MTRGRLGKALEQARLDEGRSRAQFARDLNISIARLEAIESENWSELPPGLERPLTRQVADRLGVDPEAFPESWEAIPGAGEGEAPDPRRELMERMVMGLLSAASLGLALWLVVPGPRIRTGAPSGNLTQTARPHPPSVSPAAPDQPYPVIGELLPEAPRNEEGVLVTLRAMDTTPARLESEGAKESRVIQVSEPWRFRVKGPFTLFLENAGVVKVEVAGKAVLHGQGVGEPWTGHFNAEGRWVPEPVREAPLPASAPETDPVADEGGER